MAEQPALSIQNLSKVYGERRVLDGLSIDVPPGSVYGFLGANGAGKTTALRILLGLATATSGSVHLLGRAPAASSSHSPGSTRSPTATFG